MLQIFKNLGQILPQKQIFKIMQLTGHRKNTDFGQTTPNFHEILRWYIFAISF
jgi:hypothetical protein